MAPIPVSLSLSLSLSLSPQSLWQALLSLALCLGVGLEGFGDPLTSSATDAPEPEAERSVSPVARPYMGSREGHATTEDKVKATGSSQDRVPGLVLYDSDIRGQQKGHSVQSKEQHLRNSMTLNTPFNTSLHSPVLHG